MQQDDKQGTPLRTINNFLDQEFIENMLPESTFRTILSSDSLELNLFATLIEKRLNDIESKVFRTARKGETSRAQQMLLLKHLGMLDPIINLNIKEHQKAKLLSILLNASADNIEGDLSHIQNEMSPDLATKRNYDFLQSTFNEVGLLQKAEQMDSVLTKINQKSVPKK